MSAREEPAAERRADTAEGDGRAAGAPDGPAVDSTSGALTDPDVPLFSVGQVAELVGIAPAALRRLDQQGAMRPGRSDGNQRRYSRRQIQRIQRLTQLLAEGLPIAAAHRIAELEDQVRRLTAELSHAKARSRQRGKRS